MWTWLKATFAWPAAEGPAGTADGAPLIEGAAAPLAEPVGPSSPCAAAETLGVCEAYGAAA